MLAQRYGFRQPAEIPNPKFQIPRKFQFQGFKIQKIFFCIGAAEWVVKRNSYFGCWVFEFPWGLGFGVWDFRWWWLAAHTLVRPDSAW
jgi:hypothetical protein